MRKENCKKGMMVYSQNLDHNVEVIQEPLEMGSVGVRYVSEHGGTTLASVNVETLEEISEVPFYYYVVPKNFLDNAQATYREGPGTYDTIGKAIRSAKLQGNEVIILNELNKPVEGVKAFDLNGVADLDAVKCLNVIDGLEQGLSREEIVKNMNIF